MGKVDLFERLSSNSYPGRGIVIGSSEDGKNAVIAYFIMGRSVNSRNRIFEKDGEGIRTKAFDPDLLADPSLVIYSPVKVHENKLIVTNGDQTDTIYDFIKNDDTFENALRTRTFEPDPPILTPRISGMVEFLNDTFNYRLSIIKSFFGDADVTQRFFYEYEAVKGTGHFISTYKTNGNPVPSYEGEPVAVNITGDIDNFTDKLWDALNEENKISLFVRFVDIKSGKSESRIINKNT